MNAKIYKILVLGFVLVIIVMTTFTASFGSASAIDESKAKILFDEAHGVGWTNSITNGLVDYVKVLKSEGYTVSRLTESPITYNKLQSYDILVISGGAEAYSNGEIDAIYEFVSGGGGLVLWAEGWPWKGRSEDFPFNQIAVKFGYKINKDVIKGVYTHNQEIATLTNIQNHPITKNVNAVHIVSGSSITGSGASEVVSTTDGKSVVIAGKSGKGRFVFIGDADVFDNIDYDADGVIPLYEADNKELGINIMDWLASSITLTPTPTTKAKILFDESHNTYWGCSIANGYSSFANLLRTEGYQVERSTSGLSFDELKSYDILVVVTPFTPPKPFSTSEIEAIKKFVHGGGGLVLIGGGWSWVDYTNQKVETYPLNPIAKEFGVAFNDDIIYDPTNYYPSGNTGNPIFHRPYIIDHPITKEVNTVCGCEGYLSSLKIFDKNVQIIITGDEDSYTAYHGNYYKVGENPPLLATARYGQGNVVFSGGGCFANTDVDKDGIIQLYEYDNKKLGLNIVDWLASSTTTTSPDLTLSPSDISLSDPSPLESETVTITAEIHNIGNADANNVFVQFFDGYPEKIGSKYEGTLIGSNPNLTNSKMIFLY